MVIHQSVIRKTCGTIIKKLNTYEKETSQINDPKERKEWEGDSEEKRGGKKPTKKEKLKKKLTFQFQSKVTAVLDALKTWNGDWDSQNVHNEVLRL